MIFSQYKETCEVLLDYSKIGGDNIKYFAIKYIRNLLYDNIDVNTVILIAEFPGEKVKCIEKLQQHFSGMNVSKKSSYARIFHQVTHKGADSVMNYIKRFQNAQDLSVSVGNTYS